MRITPTVAEQLRLLTDEPGGGGRLAADLDRLSRDIAEAVPSCVTVSISLTRPEGRIGLTLSILPPGAAAILASLAVPLSAAGDLLVLQAGDAGAFLLLADDLDGLLADGHPPLEVDRHLTRPAPSTTESFATSLADLSVVDQAVGVLVDRGAEPDAGRRQLERLARDTDTTLGAVARALLTSLRPGPGRRRT